MSTITSTGLGSGMDINGLVTKLVDAERAPMTTRLDKKEASLQAKISAFGSFKSSLSSLQDSLSVLGKLKTFQSVATTSSDSSVVTATANANADLGSYKVQVKQIAQNHALATNKVYNAVTDVIGSGSLTIKFGTTTYTSDGKYDSFSVNPDKASVNLTIDSTNNTLTGVRDAINKANAGVNASIVYNGTGYQLVLNSTESGAKNSLQVETSDSDGANTDSAGLSALAFNKDVTNLIENQKAQDAKLTINGLEVTSSANAVDKALKGITLNLQQAQAGKTISIDVNQSDTDINTAVTNFVGKFNDMLKVVSTSASYDAQNRTAGALLGESSVLSTVARLKSELSKPVPGLSGSVKSLVDIGVSIQKDGTLSFDSSKLSKAYATDRMSVAALFSVVGRPSDSSIVYVASDSITSTGSYAVNITQAASQGYIKGGVVSGDNGAFTIDDNSNKLKLKINGVASGDIVLTKSTYSSGTALAAELQTRINGDDALKMGGVGVKVSYVNNQFMIQSNQYGSDSQVEITEIGTQTESVLGFQKASSLTEGTGGQDVAGTIGGVAARGQGQLLTATSGDANGLSLFVDDTRTGDRGAVNFSHGIMEEFKSILTSALSNDGLVTIRTKGITASIDGIAKQRTGLDKRMAAYQAQLLTKFNAMDSILGKLQSTSSYLTQQITAMNASNKQN